MTEVTTQTRKRPRQSWDDGLRLCVYLAIEHGDPYELVGQFEAYSWRQAARIRDKLYPGCRLALVTAED